MNEQLQALHSKVSDIIYNPFVNLKDQLKHTRSLIAKQNDFADELARIDSALEELEELEDLPYGKLERIKGFNKIKSRSLKLIKELISKVS